jgi:hypothetical protein
MSDTKFTPGPWAAIEIEEGLFHVHSPKGERHNPVPVAVIDHHRDGHEATRTVTTPANAHLIAAAPDMYEALTKMAADDAFAELCAGIGEEPQWLKDARSAIAKAEGK